MAVVGKCGTHFHVMTVMQRIGSDELTLAVAGMVGGIHEIPTRRVVTGGAGRRQGRRTRRDLASAGVIHPEALGGVEFVRFPTAIGFGNGGLRKAHEVGIIIIDVVTIILVASVHPCGTVLAFLGHVLSGLPRVQQSFCS